MRRFSVADSSLAAEGEDDDDQGGASRCDDRGEGDDKGDDEDEDHGHRHHCPTATLTPIPALTPTSTVATTATLTPTTASTSTLTATPTPISTPTAIPTATPTQTSTPTNTPSATPTNSATPTPTDTATQTPTPTDTATSTATVTATNTPVPTDTTTQTPTATDTATSTATVTATNTPMSTETVTQTATQTLAPSTPTATPTLPSTPTTTATGPTPTSAPTAAAFGSITSDTAIVSQPLRAPGAYLTTGPPLKLRFAHTATLLQNGTVLITGGQGDPGVATTAEIYNPLTGTFTPTGSMSTGRSLHTATLLQNGKVLIVGGQDFNGFSIATAELYDPSTGTFSLTGSTNVARFAHTATLLPSGKVLITGGVVSRFGFGPDSTPTAEVYDPVTGAFTFTANTLMITPLGPGSSVAGHTATLLPNGTVLITGGATIGAPNNPSVVSAAIYDPGTNSFTATGSLNIARVAHTAMLLPNGKVLIAGGTTGGLCSLAVSLGGGTPLASAEIYDPATGAFTLTGNMLAPECGHAASMLSSGVVHLSGGQRQPPGGVTAEIFDPDFNAGGGGFIETDPLTFPRASHTETLLPDGRILIVGQPIFDSVPGNAELYDPTQTGGSGVFLLTGNMRLSRDSHTATRLVDGDVLITGGTTTFAGSVTTAESSAERYHPGSATFSSTGTMTSPRTNHSATLLQNGTVLVAGGLSQFFQQFPQASGVLNTAEVYHPRAGRFALTAGTMTQPRFNQTATALPNGKVLIAGGGSVSASVVSTATNTAELFDPTTASFSATGNLNSPRTNHTATLLNNGKVLFAGGLDNHNNILASAELFDPAANGGAGAFTLTGTMTAARQDQTATLLADGRVLIAGGTGFFGVLASAEIYNPATGTFTATASMILPRSAHSAVLLDSGKVLLVLGATNDFFSQAGTSWLFAELFDPAANGGGGGFVATGDINFIRSLGMSINYQSAGPTATLLNDGRVLIAGASAADGFSMAHPGSDFGDAEVYAIDTASGTRWTPIVLVGIGEVDANNLSVQVGGLPAILGSVRGP